MDSWIGENLQREKAEFSDSVAIFGGDIPLWYINWTSFLKLLGSRQIGSEVCQWNSNCGEVGRQGAQSADESSSPPLKI